MLGKTLSHYKITDKLGAGGMGEVYRAEDTNLDRQVAIKVLPDVFADDPERLARFEREAKLLASLNHTNIASIYGLEQADGKRFLVLELVEGETLAERIRKGPLPVDEALEVCRQIAEGLESAHEKGVIHRDLKPANVKITPERKAKILDFGLAKAFHEEPAATDLSHSPTITEGMTREGVILGTAAYMSPEQAKGKPVDKRADIWAWGCVLYECLRRCLEKDPNRRLRDSWDVRIEIERASEPATPSPTVAISAARPSRWRLVIPWVLVMVFSLLAGFALSGLWNRSTPKLGTVRRFSLNLPQGERLRLGERLERSSVALSPDGGRLVYVASGGGSQQLYLREMDELEARPIPGTEGARNPFFSPDGKWVAFLTSGKLRKVSLSSGASETICDALPVSSGGSWGTDDSILFTPTPTSGLVRVSADGGTPSPVTNPDVTRGEFGHLYPKELPGGKALLFTIGTGESWGDTGIAVLSFETGQWRTLIKDGTCPQYLPTGHLLYGRSGGLLVVPFDLGRLQVTGSPVRVLEGVMTRIGAEFSLSQDGSLIYLPGAGGWPERTLAWVDRQGQAVPLPVPPGSYATPRISPDGTRAVTVIYDRKTGDSQIWSFDLARPLLTRFTFAARSCWFPCWTPDGRRVTFALATGQAPDLSWKSGDGTGAEEQLAKMDYAQFPTSWSRDGRILLFTDEHPETNYDIWFLPVADEGEPQPWLKSHFVETAAVLSPDGRWIAYQSDETGRFEIYVKPFQGRGRKQPVSTNGGTEPLWAPNGRELFYREGDKMMAVAVEADPEFSAARPRLLFEGRHSRSSVLANYDITPDGQRFLMVKPGEQESALTQINIVLNWFEELKRLVPTGN
jgi:serine/threonine-protein kinase